MSDVGATGGRRFQEAVGMLVLPGPARCRSYCGSTAGLCMAPASMRSLSVAGRALALLGGGLSFVDVTAPVAIPDLFPDKEEDCSNAQHYRSDIICSGQQITEKPGRLIKIDR